MYIGIHSNLIQFEKYKQCQQCKPYQQCQECHQCKQLIVWCYLRLWWYFVAGWLWLWGLLPCWLHSELFLQISSHLPQFSSNILKFPLRFVISSQPTCQAGTIKVIVFCCFWGGDWVYEEWVSLYYSSSPYASWKYQMSGQMIPLF